MRQRSHVVFWSCCKSQTVPFFNVDEVADQNDEETDDDESDGNRN